MNNFEKYNKNIPLTEEEWNNAQTIFIKACLNKGEDRDDIHYALSDLFHETYEDYKNSLTEE